MSIFLLSFFFTYNEKKLLYNFHKMKAIILAAGEGTRLRPLTHDIPKAMVLLGGKPLMEYNMERLIPYVSEFIIVVQYKKEAIIKYF